MSADNGIYILKSPKCDGDGFEYRVTHAQAIENIEWNVPPGEFNDEMLQDYFGKCEILTEEEARKEAFAMEEDILSDGFCPILEYGISTIEMHRPFPVKKDD